MFPLRFHLSEGSAAIRTCPAEPQVCDCRGQALPSSAARGGHLVTVVVALMDPLEFLGDPIGPTAHLLPSLLHF